MKNVSCFLFILFFSGGAFSTSNLDYEALPLPALTVEANKGDVNAQTELGMRYAHGIGVKIDSNMARELFGKAVNRGNARADLELGIVYLDGEVLKANCSKGRALLAKAQSRYPAEAQYWLGQSYLDMEPVCAKNPKLGEKYIRNALTKIKNRPLTEISRLILAIEYMRGIFIKQDLKMAEHLLKDPMPRAEASRLQSLYILHSQDDKKAFHYLKRCANYNKPFCLAHLGRAYIFGYYNQEVNWSKAEYYLKRAVAQGSFEGKAFYGFMLVNHSTTKEEFAKGFNYLNEAAYYNQLFALYALGVVYEKGGLSVKKDPGKSINYYKRAAEQGYMPAVLELINLYSKKPMTAEHWKERFKWTLKAAELGDLESMEAASVYYLIRPDVVATDYLKALYWLKKAIDNGSTTAYTGIGNLYDEGLGVKKDYKVGLSYFEQGANKGDSISAYNAGLGYMRGIGMDRADPVKAKSYFLKVNTTSEAYYCAAHDLGVLYSSNQGIQTDADLAKEYFKKSAHALMANVSSSEKFGLAIYFTNYADRYAEEMYSYYSTGTVKKLSDFSDYAEKNVKNVCWDPHPIMSARRKIGAN